VKFFKIFSSKTARKKTFTLTEQFALGESLNKELRLRSKFLNIFISVGFPKLKNKDKSIFMDTNPKYYRYSIGRFSYGYPNVMNDETRTKLTIGSFCSIAGGVNILLGSGHRTNWTTTFPFNPLFKEFQQLPGQPSTKGDVIIGNDVWIGLNAMILSGVKIGDGAVIGACSVVAKNVPPYAIVAGNPAKIIRMRFDNETIDSLLRIAWWNWDLQRIKQNMPLLLSNDVKAFIDKNIT
jgi:acetyltransferase-like isoleucine patch superfamily enzyme